jgi:hypothetical protein
MNPHFATLVLGLAHQAGSALDGKLPPGAEQLPGTSTHQVAQTLIDTLGMLEEKTQGRLETDEAKLLADVLTSLRFRFIQAGKGG